MAFYDERKKGIFNVAGVGDRSGNDGSSIYAAGKVDSDGNYVRSPAYISFYNYEYDKRASFKAFIDSFSITLNTDYSVTETSGIKKINKGASLFKYSISLNVPSFSINEGMNNLAKFQELERMITVSKSKYAADQSSNKTFIDSETYVILSNLIQDGSLDPLRQKQQFPAESSSALHCIIQNLAFSPDLDMGFFEFGGDLIPKFYNLSLEITPYLRDLDTGAHVINGFKSDGDFWGDMDAQVDLEKSNDPTTKASAYSTIKYWPFGIKVTNGSAGGLSLRSINSFPNTFVNNDGSDTYTSDKKALLAIAAETEAMNKWVVFKAFLESFSYEKDLGYEETKTTAGSAAGALYANNGTKNFKYSFKIAVPADSVNEAINNCAKINVLYRMCLEFLASESSTDEKAYTSGNVFISFANFIHNPEKQSIPRSYGNSTIVIENGLKCVLNSVNLEIDTDMGFFEFGAGLIPKMFTLDFNASLVDVKDYGSQFSSVSDSLSVGDQDNIRWPFNMDYL